MRIIDGGASAEVEDVEIADVLGYDARVVTSAARLFAKFPPAQRRVATKVHGVLMRLQPRYEVGHAWNGVAYKLGSSYSCMIVGYRDHLKLMIWRGKDLDDPDGLLRGRGVNTRHVRIETERDARPAALRRLFAQQFEMYQAGESAERRPQRGAERTRRARHRMPADVRRALDGRDLLAAYRARPPYQRNDYLGWILDAKRPETRKRRVDQMLDELASGDRYMKMPYRSRVV